MMMTKTNINNNNYDDDYCYSNISFQNFVSKDTHEDEWFTSLLRRNWYNHVAHGIDRLSLYITANRQKQTLTNSD